jgi:hypothetical protein
MTVSTAVDPADPAREASPASAPRVKPTIEAPSPPSPTAFPEVPRRPMARKKVSTTVYIEPEQAEKLRLLHERTKVPVAVYIREGIELALAKYEHLLPGQLTLDAPPTRKV